MAARRNIGEVDLAAGSTIAGSPVGGGIPQANETTLGGGEVATQAETDAGSDDARIVTPLKLANFSGIPAAEAFTSGVHASTDHAGITGVPSSVGVATAPGIGVDAVVAIPGGTLAADDDYLVYEAWGTSGVDTITISLGASPIGTTAQLDGGPFYVRGLILRTGASAQVAITFASSGPNTGERNTSRIGAAEDLSTALNLTLSDGVGAVTFDALIVRKWTA